MSDAALEFSGGTIVLRRWIVLAAGNLYPQGTTTFRLFADGVIIFRDIWLDKPALMQKRLDPEHVSKVARIFIWHPRFDL